MSIKRRTLLKGLFSTGILSVCTGAFLYPKHALASWLESAFSQKTLSNAINAISHGSPIKTSDIKIKIADTVENGALVPITITTNIPSVTNISLLVERNHRPLSASFDFSSVCTGYIATRIKVKKTSNVVALVQAGGKSYIARKRVKIIKPPC